MRQAANRESRDTRTAASGGAFRGDQTIGALCLGLDRRDSTPAVSDRSHRGGRGRMPPLNTRALGLDGLLVTHRGSGTLTAIGPTASLAALWAKADGVRARIESTHATGCGAPVQSMSIGIEFTPLPLGGRAICSNAEQAMLTAQSSGGNRVLTAAMARAITIANTLGRDPKLTTRDRLAVLIRRLRPELGPTQLEQVGPHGATVHGLAMRVAGTLGSVPRTSATLAFASRYHDIGKVGIPEAILSAPRKLAPEERLLVDQHAAFGAELVAACGASNGAAEAVAHHHRRFDGGSEDARRPTCAAMISACDAYSVMTTDRPYAEAMSRDEALAELEACSGKQFHPAVVRAIRVTVNGSKRQAA